MRTKAKTLLIAFRLATFCLWLQSVSSLLIPPSANGNIQLQAVDPKHPLSEPSQHNGMQWQSGRPSIVSKLDGYEVIRPIMNAAIVEGIAPGDHPNSLQFQFHAYGKEFAIELTKNVALMAPNYQQIRLSYDRNDLTAPPTSTIVEAVNCYYHGKVAGDEESVVSLSSCNGLRGTIQAHGEHLGIEPAIIASQRPALLAKQSHLETSSRRSESTDDNIVRRGDPLRHAFPLSKLATTDHLVYRQSSLREEEKNCGVEKHTPMAPTTAAINDDVTAGEGAAPPRGRPVGDSTNGGVAATEATIPSPASGSSFDSVPSSGEVIELLVFNDNSRWKNKGDNTEADTLSIVNEVREFYRTTTFNHITRVVLVGQVTFTEGDPYEADMTDSGVAVEGERGLLQVFHKYRQLASNVLPKHDSGQLFSERRFTSNIMGLAGVGSMCSSQSGSICCMTSESIVKNAMIAAHETGHTLTMMHDGVYNTCPSGGFIMATTTGVATRFSHCSVESANQYLSSSTATCLYNYAARQSPIERSDVSWLTSSWSDCSVSCGDGYKIRRVECRDSSGAVKKPADCNQYTMPKATASCNTSIPCDDTNRATNGSREETANANQQSMVDVIDGGSSSSRTALVLTGAITGIALGCATVLWLLRTLRSRSNAKDDEIKILAKPSDSATNTSMEAEAATAKSKSVIASDGANQQTTHALPAAPINAATSLVQHAAGSGSPQRSSSGSPRRQRTNSAATAVGLHKTPRSTSRTIQMTNTSNGQ